MLDAQGAAVSSATPDMLALRDSETSDGDVCVFCFRTNKSFVHFIISILSLDVTAAPAGGHADGLVEGSGILQSSESRTAIWSERRCGSEGTGDDDDHHHHIATR